MSFLTIDWTEPQELARQSVLQNYHLPYTEADGATVTKDSYKSPEGLQDIVKLAVRFSGTTAGVINIITADKQHQIAAVGIEAAVCSREDSMCSKVFTTGNVTAIADASQDQRFTDNPFVTGEMGKVRSYASVPLETQSGDVLGTLCVFSPHVIVFDIDQREGLQILGRQVVEVLELQHKTKQLDEALVSVRKSNEELAGFAARVSHDLKNPLTSILGYIELTEQDHDIMSSTSATHSLKIIRRSASRMLSTIEEILEFSRIGGAITRSTIHLSSVLQDVLQDVQPLSCTNEPVITAQEAQLYVDQTQVSALLQNLVSNALKYSLAGVPPQIEITASTDERQILRVIDHGKGIDPQERKRVLEPLVRLRRAGDPAGHGIGLATCLRIAIAHEGSIELAETLGGGTTAIVDLGPSP